MPPGYQGYQLNEIYNRLNSMEKEQAKVDTVLFGSEGAGNGIVHEVEKGKVFQQEIRALINKGFGAWWLASIVLQLLLTIVLHRYFK